MDTRHARLALVSAVGVVMVATSASIADAATPARPRPVAGACADGTAVAEQPTTIDLLPYIDFFSVPQLGCEPVAGSGCGADGSIGDVIADGLWRGQIASLEATSLEFNLWCAYVGDLGQQMAEEFMAEHPDYGSPPYIGGQWIVDNNPRTRTVPLAEGFRVGQNWWIPISVESAEGSADRRCSGSPDMPPVSGAESVGGSESWLLIENGAAVSAVLACPHD